MVLAEANRILWAKGCIWCSNDARLIYSTPDWWSMHGRMVSAAIACREGSSCRG